MNTSKDSTHNTSLDEVSKLKDMFGDLSLSSTITDQPEQGLSTHEEGHQYIQPLRVIHEYEEVQLCNKYDAKEESPRALQVAQEEARWSPTEMVDGLAWYGQLKRLEKRAEINREYEEEMNAVEEKFVASAVMMEPSDLEGINFSQAPLISISTPFTSYPLFSNTLSAPC